MKADLLLAKEFIFGLQKLPTICRVFFEEFQNLLPNDRMVLDVVDIFNADNLLLLQQFDYINMYFPI
jgi:hypothetical protein